MSSSISDSMLIRDKQHSQIKTEHCVSFRRSLSTLKLIWCVIYLAMKSTQLVLLHLFHEMKKLTHRLFGGSLRLGALGPGPPGPLDKTALGTNSWLDDTDKNFGPDLPLLFKLHEIWSVDSQENHYNFCQQMSYFKAKMHRIRLWLGAPPQTPLGELTALPRPPNWI